MRRNQLSKDIPASLIGKTVSQASHLVTNGCPFCTTDDTNVLNRQDGEEEVLVGTVIPVLEVHHGGGDGVSRDGAAGQSQGGGAGPEPALRIGRVNVAAWCREKIDSVINVRRIRDKTG